MELLSSRVIKLIFLSIPLLISFQLFSYIYFPTSTFFIQDFKLYRRDQCFPPETSRCQNGCGKDNNSFVFFIGDWCRFSWQGIQRQSAIKLRCKTSWGLTERLHSIPIYTFLRIPIYCNWKRQCKPWVLRSERNWCWEEKGLLSIKIASFKMPPECG